MTTTTPHAVHDTIRVAFHVYSWSLVPLPVAAERLHRVVPFTLNRHYGERRGAYYRWSGDDGADLLLERNVLDENGQPIEPDAPVHAPLVYATGLPKEVHLGLAGIEGLTLLAAELVTVPRTARASGPRQPVSSL